MAADYRESPFERIVALVLNAPPASIEVLFVTGGNGLEYGWSVIIQTTPQLAAGVAPRLRGTTSGASADWSAVPLGGNISSAAGALLLPGCDYPAQVGYTRGSNALHTVLILYGMYAASSAGGTCRRTIGSEPPQPGWLLGETAELF